MEAIIICVIAGALAGIGTGFAGLSAASFITPMLVSFLDVPAYEAVGIALTSDVLASAFSALIYRKSGNLDLKTALPLTGSVLVFTILGSILAYMFSITSAGNTILGYWAIVAAFGLGIQFLLHPVRNRRAGERDAKGARPWLILLCGLYIGMTCGFQGVGGGLLILFSLAIVMGYDFKTAVGTSVFIMTFTALIGGASHFLINGLPDLTMLAVCCVSTAAFAVISAHLANRWSERTLGLSIGWVLTLSAAITFVIKLMN